MSVLNAVDPKDPDESKIYTMDWSAQLNTGATISTSTWTLAAPLASAGAAIVAGAKQTSIQITGGQDGQDYEVLNEVTTSDGETLRQAGLLPVRKARRG